MVTCPVCEDCGGPVNKHDLDRSRFADLPKPLYIHCDEARRARVERFKRDRQSWMEETAVAR